MSNGIAFKDVVDFATLVTGVGAVLTAYYSWQLSKKALAIQDKHNKLSLTPYPFVTFSDYEDRIGVKFINDGNGAFLVKRIWVCRGNDVKSDILSWMPKPPQGLSWTDFTSAFEGRALRPESELILLSLKGDPDDYNFMAFRDICRHRLSKLTVYLEYTDLYKQSYPIYSRSLKWFSRDHGTYKKR